MEKKCSDCEYFDGESRCFRHKLVAGDVFFIDFSEYSVGDGCPRFIRLIRSSEWFPKVDSDKFISDSYDLSDDGLAF